MTDWRTICSWFVGYKLYIQYYIQIRTVPRSCAFESTFTALEELLSDFSQQLHNNGLFGEFDSCYYSYLQFVFQYWFLQWFKIFREASLIQSHKLHRGVIADTMIVAPGLLCSLFVQFTAVERQFLLVRECGNGGHQSFWECQRWRIGEWILTPIDGSPPFAFFP